MDVQLTPDQQTLISRAINDGRIRGADEAVQQALDLWADRESARAELIASLDEAEASIERGEGIIITKESMRVLADDIKQRGRARLAAKQPAPR